MITLVFFLPYASGLVCAKNLRKWAEKAFASSTLVFHALVAMHSQSNVKSPQTLATANFLTHYIISIAVLENVPPDTELQKRATFSTLNVGLAGTGNRTRATCVAGSVARRSAIHYAFCPAFLVGKISLGVNTPSSSGNVYFANGQPDRILVPYLCHSPSVSPPNVPTASDD
jgi:hypothetical protein